MKKKIIKLNYKGKEMELEVRKVPWWYEGIGLMFSSQKRANALLFSFRIPTKMSIFSSFIPFDFLAIWLNKKGQIIEKRIVRRGDSGVFPSEKFVKLIEIPITEKYDEVLSFLEVKERFK